MTENSIKLSVLNNTDQLFVSKLNMCEIDTNLLKKSIIDLQLTDNRVLILDTYASTAIEILCEVSCELKQYRVKHLSNVT